MSGQSNFPAGGDAFPQVQGFQTTALASSTSTTRVWDAVQLSLDRPVRLLTPVAGDPASESAFPRVEALARVFSRLASADVVQVIDVSKTPEGTPYVVLEKLDGDTLASVLRTGGPMNAARALGILSRLAATLSSLWDRGGIVLRNLKSASVVLGPGDVPKIAAFHSADMPNAAAALPPDGATLVGTPQYMAPEQTDGVSRIDWRADLYAAGALFFEMLTGRPPFAWAADPMEVLRLQREASEPAPSDARPGVPLGCSQLLSRMMAKKPADRYASWSEALADVAALAGGALELRLPEAPFASTVALPAAPDRPSAAVPPADSAANSAAARITLKPRIPVAIPPAPAPTARVAPSSPATAPTAASAPVSASPVPKRTIVLSQRRPGGVATSASPLQKTAKAAPVQPLPQSPATPAASKKGGVPLPLRAAGAVFVLALLGFVAWKRIGALESAPGADADAPAGVAFAGEDSFDSGSGGDFGDVDADYGEDYGDDYGEDGAPAVADAGVSPAAPAAPVRRPPASRPTKGPGSGREAAPRGAAGQSSAPETAVADSSGPAQAPAADLPPPSFARRSAPASSAGSPPNPFKNRGRGGSGARRVAPRGGGGGVYQQQSGAGQYQPQSQPGSVSASLLLAAMNSGDSGSSAQAAPSAPPPPVPSLEGSEDEVAAAVAKYLVQWVREQPFADAKSHAQSFLRGASEKRSDLAKSFRSLAAPFRQSATFEDLVGHALSKSPAERDVTLGGVQMRIRPTGYGSPVLMCDFVGKNGQISKNRKLSLDRMTDAEKLAVVSSLVTDKEPGALASRAFLLLRAGTAEQFRDFVRRYKLVDLAPLARAVAGEVPAEAGGAGDGAAK